MSLPVLLHVTLASLALAVGGAMLARRKGTRSHKLLGRIWVVLMLAVAASSFWSVEIRNGAGLGALAPGRALHLLFFA